METYKIGDYVLLTSTSPVGWSSSMTKFLGQVVKITDIRDKTFSWEGDEGYTYQLTDIIKILTSEEMEAIKKEEEKREEKYKHYIYQAEKIEKLAIDIFGEERVYSQMINNLLSLYIHFPEITITNSKRQTHLIKDLYIQYDIQVRKANFNTSNYKLEVSFSGKRAALSLKEWEGGYRHSHLMTGSNIFSCFCLGRSDYSILLQSLQIEPTENNWMLVFLGLENYLSWESLEGGPYLTIDSIKYSSDKTDERLVEEAERLANGIPISCWEFTNTGIELIANHPSLYNYFNENSTIKQLHTYSLEQIKMRIETLRNHLKGSYPINWKGETIDVTVYEDLSDNLSVLSREVVEKYCEILKEKSIKFLKQHQYDRGKQKNERKVFGKIRD